MLSRENAMREALSELEAQRARNYEEERRRREALAQQSSEAARLLIAREQTLFAGMRRAFDEAEQAQTVADAMQTELAAQNAALRAELSRLGLPEDWLQPVYRCAICGDTGYVGDLIREPCQCLRHAVLARMCREEGLQGLAEQNFACFDEGVFPDVPVEGRKRTQRAYIRLIRERCETYADGFARDVGKGLLFIGQTGVGKTYMMNCVAQRVLERGFSALVISAFKLTALMRQYQFNGKDADQVQELLDCDLLCIDDLGSEQDRGQETASGLYHIVSERMNEHRAIVVTTNCSIEQLYQRFGDRIAARLCDPGRMQIFDFPGQDVRRYAAERAMKQGFEE